MELFKIGFITVRVIDIIDIAIVGYVFFKLYKIMRGTIAFQIFFALLLIIGFSFIAKLLNMHAIGWLLSKLTDIWVIAFIILFQPEIRRLLLIIGRTNIARLFLKIDINQDITELVDACIDFQKRGWGALIVITRTTGIQNIVETGIPIQSKINTELLVSIFNPKSPLHDGAVVINNNRIEAAKCLLPLSETMSVQNRNLGTRHRAGLGLSEVSDAITIIVSEERSVISIAEDGQLYITKDSEDLKEKLIYALSNENVAKSVMKVFAKTDEKTKSE
ncbi:MAG TPA: diadenylate cyclase CdaA [Ignavibacteria bacterium]